MASEAQQLQAGIAAFEAQRAQLGDAVVDMAIAPLRERLAAIAGADAGAGDRAAAPGQTAQTGQVRKQVTVLFLDVVGSTALAQHLDPEDIHAVMDRTLERCTAIVDEHGGRVLQYAGDSLLAVFGADAAREDDAERAVHAGLALLAEGSRQGRAVLERHGHAGFDVRVGIHTGAVLLGGGVDADGSIRGMAVNIAARMEQSAPPGALRISRDTHHQVRGLFAMQAQPPLVVKGHDEPIATWIVERSLPREFRAATRGIDGVTTPLIGRDAELARLRQAWLAMHDGAAGMRWLTIVGDAGVGKSRLLDEFVAWQRSTGPVPLTLRGRAHPQDQGRPYGLMSDVIATALGLADGDSADAVRRRIDETVVPLLADADGAALAQAQSHLLGHLMGYDYADSPHLRGIADDGRQIRDRGFHAASQCLRGLARASGAPALLLIDDLHWADDASLDFLDHFAAAAADAPLLVLALSRPAIAERRALPGAAAASQVVVLAPLADDDSAELVGQLLRRLGAVPPALRESITSRAAGNPYCMEELVRMLLDQGAIVADADADATDGDGRWRLDDTRLQPGRMPASLTGVLQARLDALPAPERHTLQWSALVGFVFWDGALAAVDDDAAAALPAIAGRDLVRLQAESSYAGSGEYTFSHPLLHQVAYDTLLKGQRRAGHARVAAWLQQREGARAGDLDAAIAWHCEAAGDLAGAAEHAARAAEHAAARHAHEAAHALVARVLALAAADDHALRWRVVALRERLLDLQGRRDEQRADVAALHALAESLDDDQHRADAAWRACDLAARTGDVATLEAASLRAMQFAERAQSTELLLRAKARWVLGLVFAGRVAEARDAAMQALALARSQRLRASEARLLNLLSMIADRDGDLAATMDWNLQSLQVDRELGNRANEGIALGNIGNVCLSLGDFESARRHAADSLQLMRSIGYRVMQGKALLTLSAAALAEGDTAMALEHGRAALAIATAVQDPTGEGTAWLRIGEALLAAGDPVQASEAFARSRDMDLAAGRPDWAIDGSDGMARCALATGDIADALSHVEAMLAAVPDGQACEGSGSSLGPALSCWRVLTAARDPRAAAVLATAHAALLAKAAAIADERLRAGYLGGIAAHREIAAAVDEAAA